MVTIRETKIYHGGYICLLKNLLTEQRLLEKHSMLGCIEIKTENNAEKIIMLLCETVRCPHCGHGIQF